MLISQSELDLFVAPFAGVPLRTNFVFEGHRPFSVHRVLQHNKTLPKFLANRVVNILETWMNIVTELQVGEYIKRKLRRCTYRFISHNATFACHQPFCPWCQHLKIVRAIRITKEKDFKLHTIRIGPVEDRLKLFRSPRGTDLAVRGAVVDPSGDISLKALYFVQYEGFKADHSSEIADTLLVNPVNLLRLDMQSYLQSIKHLRSIELLYKDPVV